MKDTTIKGSGNSRSMKTVPNAPIIYPDFDTFIHEFASNGIPFDMGPLNLAGVLEKGTDLNKSTLLTDETAALYGKDSSAVPDDIFSAIPEGFASNTAWKRTFVKFDTSTNWSPPETMLGDTVLVVAIGGGGGGGGAGGTGSNGAGGGGGSGYIKITEVKIDKNSTYPIQIGAGGAGGEAPTNNGGGHTDARNGKDGSPGGATSFGNLVIAAGGEEGHHGCFGRTENGANNGSGNGGNGGSGSSGGSGGAPAGGSYPGTTNQSGRGGDGIGSQGVYGTGGKGGKGGDGLSLLSYPQAFLPLLITDTDTELLGGKGGEGNNNNGLGGEGGIGKIISGGAGGRGGPAGGGGSFGSAGGAGSPGVLYVFYQEALYL